MKKIFGVILVVLIAMMIFILPSYAQEQPIPQEQTTTVAGYYFCPEIQMKLALMPDGMAYLQKVGGPIAVGQYKLYDANKVVMLDLDGQGLMFKPNEENLVYSEYNPKTDTLRRFVFAKQVNFTNLTEFLEQ